MINISEACFVEYCDCLSCVCYTCLTSLVEYCDCLSFVYYTCLTSKDEINCVISHYFFLDY